MHAGREVLQQAAQLLEEFGVRVGREDEAQVEDEAASLGLLRVRDDVILLHAMRWPDEIRDPVELLPPPVEVSDDGVEGPLALMETMARDDLEGEDFKDICTEGMAKIIESKRQDKPLPQDPHRRTRSSAGRTARSSTAAGR